MPNYISHTFTAASDTEFQSEFADFIAKRNIYLAYLAQDVPAEPHYDPFLVAVGYAGLIAFSYYAIANTAIFGIEVPGVVNAYTIEKYRYMSIATAEELAAGRVANGIAQGGYDRIFYGLIPSVYKKKTEKELEGATESKRLSQAHLDMLVAKRVLKAAITADLGDDYTIVKWIGETEAEVIKEGGNDLILKLRAPDYETRPVEIIGATTATLRSQINPRHIITGAQFKYGLTTAYGSVAPADYEDLGKGQIPINYTANITGLTPETLYHYCIVANSKYLGVFTGEDLTFTTLQGQGNFTVTFNGNGSDGGTTAPQVTNVPTALTVNGFTLTGYNFDGWNTAANGSGTAYADQAEYAFNADVTLYAQWVLVSHTVTFNGNGNDSGGMSPQVENEPTALTVNNFGLSNFTFSGWNTMADGTGTAYADQAEYAFATDATLYAQWLAIPHTVTFNGNGSSSGSMPQQTESGETALDANAFLLTNYNFNGWNTAANGSGIAYADQALYPFAVDATLYAQWVAVTYTVTFNGNSSDGGSMTPQNANSPTALTLNAFTKTGFAFSGWDTDSGGLGTDYADEAEYSFTSDITLYAQWI